MPDDKQADIDHLLPPDMVATFEKGANKRANELEVAAAARRLLNDARDISLIVHLGKQDTPVAFTIAGGLI